MRCDAHLHLWDPARSRYAWLAGAPQPLHRAFRPEEVLEALGARGIDRLVLVQADDTREDTALMQELAREIPRRAPGIGAVGVVAWLPLARPDLVGELLSDAEAMEHVVGVRHLTHDDPDPFFLRRDEVGRSLAQLAEAGLPLDVPDAFPAQLAYLPELAAEHPRLTIVLDHLGKPPLGDAAALRTWREMLSRLAAQPNAVAKCSGLATSGPETDPAARAEGIAAALEHARRCFGAERLLFGSDWPIAPAAGDYASAADQVLAHLGTWSEAEQGAVLGGTADRVYRGRA
ncbi:amidohydrolase family protein [Brachybacterium phenoliresistens]|uniref:amidohydrolase family protein n=1 Tax=Brachybacterium phenoliresistens TaxID=396014 RepID=UPI0031E196B5